MELENAFRTLKHLDYLNMAPWALTHWCDNKRAVERSMEPLPRPTEMIVSDCDLVLAIHGLKAKLAFPVKCRHVYGHQDSTAWERGLHTKSNSNRSSGGGTIGMKGALK